MEDKKSPSESPSSAIQLLKILLAFSLGIAISLYFLGYIIGRWLDARYGTGSLFAMIGYLVAIFLSFYRLIKDFSALDKKSKKPKGPNGREE